MIFPPTYPFGGIADGYESNDFDTDKLWNMGVRIFEHKIGQWDMKHFETNKTLYLKRKALWIAKGGIFGAYYLPHATGTAAEHFASMEAVDDDPAIQRDLDYEEQWTNGPIVPEAVLDELAKMIHDKYGRWPIKYGARSIIDSITLPNLLQCDTWFANPNGTGKLPATFNPHNPPPKTKTWQYTEDGDPITEQNDGLDFNVFDGNEVQALAYFGPPMPEVPTLASHSEGATGALPG